MMYILRERSLGSVHKDRLQQNVITYTIVTVHGTLKCSTFTEATYFYLQWSLQEPRIIGRDGHYASCAAWSCGSYCFETLILFSANTLTHYNIERSTRSNSEGSLPIFHNRSDTFKEIHRCDKGKYINLLFSYRSMLTVRSVRLLKGVSRVLDLFSPELKMHSWKEESQDTLLKPHCSRISCNIIITE